MPRRRAPVSPRTAFLTTTTDYHRDTAAPYPGVCFGELPVPRAA
jgi:hypothetical protein